MCNSSFLDSNIFAAIVGGMIGFLSSIITSIWYSGHQAKIAKYNGYKAWCNGVQAEVNHLNEVMNELDDVLKNMQVPPTKRLNHDYLEQARIKIIEYESDLEFLETLTNAYRDVVHTNDMLDRLEKDFATRPQVIGNVIASVKGVRASMTNLNVRLQIKINALKKP